MSDSVAQRAGIEGDTLERVVSLKSQLQQILKERILSGEYPPASRFPSESELVEAFSVSRPTVRSALSVLEAEGLIVRKQGVGTYVREMSAISHPVSEVSDFLDVIAASGFQPGVMVGQADLFTAGNELAQALAVAEGSDMLRIEKVFTASGSPVIYVVNAFPVWVVGQELLNEVLTQPQITEPIYEFLEERCGQSVAYHVAILQACLVQACEIEITHANPLDPMVVMESVAYNTNDRPVFRSRSAYPDKRVQFRLVRRRTTAGKPQ
ncbi:GntR family transcriptional regulator [Chloroflexota bacterium]